MSNTLVVDTTLQATQQASDFSVLGFKSILPTSTNTPEELTIDTFRDGVRPLLLSNPLTHILAPGDAEKFLTNGTLTTDRATIGTRVNKTTKLVETLAIDTLREEVEGFLIEGASTNEALHNRDFTNAVHVKTNITPLKNAIGADGVANSASTLTATAANGTVFQTIVKASAENTYSIDVRRKTGTGTIEISDDGAGSFTDITSSINNSTYTRFQITTTQVSPSFGVRIVASGDEIEVDYEGLEVLPFASSRIETTTTAVTRAADDVSILASGNIPGPTEEYSVLATVDVLGVLPNTSDQQNIMRITGESFRLMRAKRFSGDNLDFRSGDADIVSSTSPFPSGQIVKISGTVDPLGSISLYEDGIIVGSTDYTADPTGTATSISIGSNSGASNFLFGHISDFMIFERALNQLEIITINSGAALPATNSSEEDPLFPFVNALDFRDNTKYSPLVTSGTVVIEFNQSVIQPIDYFAFAIHNSQDAGLTGKLEVDTGAGFEIVAEFASVKNNRPFLKFFGTKNTQRQKLTLNFTSKVFIGTIFLGEAVIFNRTPSLGFQPGRTAPLDTVEQFTTDGNNFIIGRRINRGFNEQSTFRFVKFDDIDLFYEDFQNHVLDSKSVFFKWSNTKNQTIFGLQNARTMTKPQYVTSFHADISFDISGYS